MPQFFFFFVLIKEGQSNRVQDVPLSFLPKPDRGILQRSKCLTFFVRDGQRATRTKREDASSSFRGRSCSATEEHGIGYLPWVLCPSSGVSGVCVVAFSSPLSLICLRVWPRPLPVLIMVSSLTSNYSCRLKTRGEATIRDARSSAKINYGHRDRGSFCSLPP